MKKVLVTVALLGLSMLGMLSTKTLASNEKPIGLGVTFDRTVKFAGSYDLLSTSTKRSGLILNSGVYIAQRAVGNWDTFSLGPQMNLEYKRLFVSVNYNIANRDTKFFAGIKVF